MPQDSSQADFWNSRYQDGITPWNAAGIPEEIAAYAAQRPAGRVLIPGCGHGHEVQCFMQDGHEVDAIDFSPDAVRAAQQTLGPLASHVRQADFFTLPDTPGYDWIYERAFLCALPRKCWPLWGDTLRRLIRPGGHLAGYFFLDDNERGPPFGTAMNMLVQLLGAEFSCQLQAEAKRSLPVFAGREYWMVWQRHPIM